MKFIIVTPVGEEEKILNTKMIFSVDYAPHRGSLLQFVNPDAPAMHVEESFEFFVKKLKASPEDLEDSNNIQVDLSERLEIHHGNRIEQTKE